MTVPAPTVTPAPVVVRRLPGPAERAPRAHRRRRRLLETGLGIGVPVLLLVFWQLASSLGWVDSRSYPAPTTILDEAWTMSGRGELWPDIAQTGFRILSSFLIGALIGFLVGLATGLSPMTRAALEPLLNGLYTVPKLALLPIFLTVFGFGQLPQLMVVAVTVFFFVWISTSAAIVAVPEGFRDAGRSMGFSRVQMFTHVLFPAALPQVFVGLRIAAGVAVLVIIATEFLVGDNGLGFLIFDAQRLFLTAPMYVGIVCSALLGVLFTAIITWIGRKACPWAPRGNDIQPR